MCCPRESPAGRLPANARKAALEPLRPWSEACASGRLRANARKALLMPLGRILWRRPTLEAQASLRGQFLGRRT
eukprot:7777150-Alexandrium_andersonii.AAC.1